MIDRFKTLRQALPISMKADKGDGRRRLLIASSMETYYYEVFLKAYCYEAGTPVEAATTEFGNLGLSLVQDSIRTNDAEMVIILEWEDFFPGLSLRSGAALPQALPDSLDEVPFWSQLVAFIRQRSSRPVYLIPPHMEVSPVAVPEAAVQRFFAEVILGLNQLETELTHLKIIQPDAALAALPRSEWNDSGLWMKMGWAYSLEATSRLAEATATALRGSADRKKLLITDLDNTLWHGLIGEEGVASVSWEAEDKGYKHRIYQKFLNQIAGQGTLLAVCSKNEEAVAMTGIQRPDLIVDAQNFVATEIGWGLKSEAVQRILDSLNIGAADTLFVDDTVVECEEVASGVKGIETLTFPKDNRDLLFFLEQLKAHFPARVLTDDDRRRVALYKARETVTREARSSSDHASFLKGLKMVLEVERVESPEIERPFQLINKTNQFNLNGIREDAASWQAFFDKGGEVYQFRLKDRIADHGIIAVLAFKVTGDLCHLHHFVLSCRVFSRRVEHAILDWLRTHSSASECSEFIARFFKTERNLPLCTFLESFAEGQIANLSSGDVHQLLLTLGQGMTHSVKIVSMEGQPT